jgi:hypothetical protein
LERRREWAASRTAKANANFAVGEPFRGDIAFNTQPGHIPARARVIRATERAFGHMDMAAHHEAKAAGIERQLRNTVFSDDDDATEALQAKIDAGRAEIEQMKAANKIIRKFKKDLPAGYLALEQAGFSAALARSLFEPDFAGRIGFASYQLTNLGANVRRMEKRIEEIKAMRQRAESAEDKGGVSIEGNDYISVTFAEKPSRDILNDLRNAGFRWGRGSWSGRRENLPQSVKDLTEAEDAGALMAA